MSLPKQKRLTFLLARFLGITRFAVLCGSILLPLLTAGYALDVFGSPEFRHVDVYLKYRIEAELIPVETALPTTLVDQVIGGRGGVRINTRSPHAWYLTAVIGEIVLLALLYSLGQMRALFASLLNGGSFTRENAGRTKKIGYIVICWQLVSPLLQYFGGLAVLNNIALKSQAIHLFPTFNISITGLFVGLAIIVLSGVLEEATAIHQEQSLTI